MVLLHLKTDNALNTTLAKFDSLYQDSFIQYSNINNNIYLSGIANNNFKIYNPLNANDNGLIYNNNILTVRSHNTQVIKNENEYTEYPNDITSIYSYQFTEKLIGNLNPFENVFNNISNRKWTSEAIYTKASGIGRCPQLPEYQFKNKNSYGYWGVIKFPYQIIPVKISFSDFYTGSLVNPVSEYNVPQYFDLYLSNDNINWIQIYSYISTVGIKEFSFANSTLYSYIGIVITKINLNPAITADNQGQSFNIDTIKIYSKPILHFDNNIKIIDNNLLNVDILSTNKLVLNNSTITNETDLQNVIVTKSLQEVKNLYNIYWQSNATTGFFNSNIINKLSINSNFANSTLDINGDIAFKQRSLNNSFTLTNKGAGNTIASSNVYIGKISCISNTINYFNLSLILFEFDKYYFQTIDINGNYYSTSNLNIYWKTTFDSTYLMQRIIGINYKIVPEVNNITSICFYLKYNPVLNITSAVNTISNPNSDYINNIIYSDLIATSHLSNINFSIRSPTNVIIDNDNNIYSNAYLISSICLNSNNDILDDMNVTNLIASNINSSNISLFNNSIINSNFLMLNNDKKIIDSGISSNTLARFINLPNLANKIVGTNSNGNITYLNESSLLLSNLNKLNTTPNSILIIDRNSNFSTTSSIPLSNINNVMNLFDFNKQNNRFVCNSNMQINKIFIGNSHIITSNNDKLLINNREIPDDIFKLITKIPFYQYNPQQPPTESINGNMITYDIDIGDTSMKISTFYGDENSDDENILNIFKNLDINRYWKTRDKFKNYTKSINERFSVILSLYETDIDGNTIYCGAYIIFEFQFEFILNYYIIYVNYPYLKNSIREFDLYGYDNVANGWRKIHTQRNLIMKNNLIPNVFYINKTYFTNYSKYAFCILNTNNNTEGDVEVYINGFEFYGYRATRDDTSKLYSYNNEYNIPVLFGINNVGIHNFKPFCPLSIGDDLPSNPTTSMININHPSFVDNIESNIITITRPSTNSDYKGIKATHYLNSFFDSNTNYTIKLSQSNITNEKVILSMNSTGNVAIGGYPSSNLNNNGLSLYDNNSNYVNIYSDNLESSYSIILPPNSGMKDMSLYINSITDNNVNLKFKDPLNVIADYSMVDFQGVNLIQKNFDKKVLIKLPSETTINSNYSVYLPKYEKEKISSNQTFIIDRIVDENKIFLKFDNPVRDIIDTTFIKIGDQSLATINECNITVQLAGKCVIAHLTTDITGFDRTFLTNKALTVIGKSYISIDTTVDSDISYKYNIKLIDDPLGKINKLNGYTFNRNDTDDDKRYSGLIAQEVIKVMPEVVTVKHDGKYRIIYTTLAGLFVEAIKKLDNKYDYINLKLNCFIGIVGLGLLYLYKKR